MDVGGTTCGGCGADMPATASLCSRCGWDQTTALARPARPALADVVRAAVPRVAVYGLLAAAIATGFARWAEYGPGPDLATTLRWLALGDGGRTAELVTLHRAHEISKAAARYAVREMAPPDFAAEWDRALAPYSTMRVRGWIPLLFAAADAERAPASVRELYEVRGTDGWGRRYRVSGMPLAGGSAAGPEVAADLEHGLWRSFFEPAPARLDPDADWMRIEIGSAGPDGRFDTGDDLRFLSYVQTGFTIALQRQGPVQRQLEVAFVLGRHRYRYEGARHGDLVDARLLAEFRLDLWR